MAERPPGGRPEPTALVWLKRDLRLRDHAPLAEAARFERAFAVYLVEPEWLASPEFHPQHWRFVRTALTALRAELAARGLPLLVRIGSAVEVLAGLPRFSHLLSHEETGSGWTYDRDRAVARWCRAAGVAWTEYPQTGVVRRLGSRDGWATAWERRMDAPEVSMPAGWRAPPGLAADPLPALDLPAPRQPARGATEADAWATLSDFLGGRGQAYRSGLSSPLTAETSCSRLSEHLAYGTLSMRCVHQATEAAIRRQPEMAAALRAFAGRLRWHCHFMQKLEDEPAIEFRNFARSHDGLRPGDGRPLSPQDEDRLAAWCEGRTGYPMVDACMRQLLATGWLNFRMRAMLVSFAAYHLGLHWRAPGLHLARCFLDFEPGIHWSQMQMQSGTTG
ncbi:MAG: FAD-binding domain-containing protein, partial [Roseateles sp.]